MIEFFLLWLALAGATGTLIWDDLKQKGTGGFIEPTFEKLVEKYILRKIRKLSEAKKNSLLINLLLKPENGLLRWWDLQRVLALTKYSLPGLLVVAGLGYFLHPALYLLSAILVVFSVGIPSKLIEEVGGETANTIRQRTAVLVRGIAFALIDQMLPEKRNEFLRKFLPSKGSHSKNLILYLNQTQIPFDKDFLIELEQANDTRLVTYAADRWLQASSTARAGWLASVLRGSEANPKPIQVLIEHLEWLLEAEQQEVLVTALKLERVAPETAERAREILLQKPDLLDEADWIELCRTGSEDVLRFSLLQLARVAGTEGEQLLAELLEVPRKPYRDWVWAALLFSERTKVSHTRLLLPPNGPVQLKEAHPDVAMLAIEAVWRMPKGIRSLESVDLLLSAAGHKNTKVRELLDTVLVKVPTQSLYQAVQEKGLTTSQTTVLLAALIRKPPFLPFFPWLNRQCRSENELLRRLALQALYQTNPEEALANLLECARHETDRGIRSYAHEQILLSDDGRVLPYLLQLHLAKTAEAIEQLAPGAQVEVLKKRMLRSFRRIQERQEFGLGTQFGLLYCLRTRRRPRQVLIEGFTFFTVGPNDFDLRDVETGIETVVGVIGDLPPAQAGTLYLPLWDEATKQAQPAEVDKLEVRPSAAALSYDWAIAAVTGQLAHATQLPQRRALPIEVYVPLSENALRQLQSLHNAGLAPQVTLRVA